MNKKKLLALLMALVMTLSLVPVTALASETDATVTNVTENLTAKTVEFVFNLTSADNDSIYNLDVKVNKGLASGLTFYIKNFRTPVDGGEFTANESRKLLGNIVSAIEAGDQQMPVGPGFNRNTLVQYMNNNFIFTCGVQYDTTAVPAGTTMTVQVVKSTDGGTTWDDVGDPVTCVLNPVAAIGDTGYATLEAAFAAAVDGDTITLLANCDGNGIVVPQGKFTAGLTVDFANHTYTVSGNPVGSTGTETIGFQLLKDNNITFENGTIYADSTTNENLQRLVQNYSNLTLDGMTLDMKGAYYNQLTISNCNGAITIKDSIVNAPDFSWLGYPPAQAALSKGEGGVGAQAMAVGTFSTYPSVGVTVTGTSVINGNVKVACTNNGQAELNLNGGTLNGNLVMGTNATITKSADFNAAAPTGYYWNDNGVLTKITGVAAIGTTGYATLAEAFAAAVDGDTITLLADCAGDGIKATQGKFSNQGLTVDFAGHTYTVDGETVGSTGTETNGFQLLKDNKITFKNGTITSAKAKILVQNYSDLTLEGMTLTLNNPNYTGAYTLSNNNGNVVIDGTTIYANEAGGYAFDVCRYSSYPSVNVTVTGNSVINGDVEISASGSDAKDGFSLTLTSGTINGEIVLDASAKAAMAATPNVATITKDDGFTQTAPEGYKWDETGKLVEVTYVARIGETKYETLQAALDAVQDGQTITLLGDLTQEYGVKFDKNVTATLDLGNHTFKVTKGGSDYQSRNVYITAGNLTIQNGTMNAWNETAINDKNHNDGNHPYGTVRTDGTAKATLKNLTLYNNHCWGLNIKACGNSEIEIRNCIVNSTIGGGFEAAGGKIDVYDSTFNQSGKNTAYSWIASAIAVSAVNSIGEVNVYNTTFQATAEYALYVYSSGGTINVYSGTFTGNTKAAVVQHTYPNNVSTINIYGGTVNGAFVNGGSEKDIISISGGTFDHDPSAYVASGYTAIDNGNGTWTVGQSVTNITGTTNSENTEITPVVVTNSDDTKTLVVKPVANLKENTGTTTEIELNNLATAANTAIPNFNSKEVKIITGLSANQAVNGAKAPQTVITDGDKVFFAAKANGGQLRLDKKFADGTHSAYNATYNNGTNGVTKAQAIDYVDLRLQFQFTLPEGVSPTADTTHWYWTVKYNGIEKTVNGVNFLPVSGKTSYGSKENVYNTYTSNVVVTNIPVSRYGDLDFSATLTISYEYLGVTYTISQSSEVPLTRDISELVNYYIVNSTESTYDYARKIQDIIESAKQ